MTPIEIGDLFRDRDPRSNGRVVRVVAVDPGHGIPKVYRCRVVEHWNESVIGRRTWINETTLLGRYTRVSH
jgi:hypothetical protein